MSSSKYKVYHLCFKKENPKTNFDLVIKINAEDDYDFNIILTLSNEIYIKEFDKNLTMNKIISIIYDASIKHHNFDTKIDYSLSDNIKKVDDKLETSMSSDIDDLINNLNLYMDDFKNKLLSHENALTDINDETEINMSEQVVEVKSEEIQQDVEQPVVEEEADIPDISTPDIQPVKVTTDVQPDEVKTDIQPEEVTTDVQPDEVKTDIQPEEVTTNVQPLEVKTDIQPDEETTDVQPDGIKTDIQPDEPIDDIKSKVQPEEKHSIAPDAQTKQDENNTLHTDLIEKNIVIQPVEDKINIQQPEPTPNDNLQQVLVQPPVEDIKFIHQPFVENKIMFQQIQKEIDEKKKSRNDEFKSEDTIKSNMNVNNDERLQELRSLLLPSNNSSEKSKSKSSSDRQPKVKIKTNEENKKNFVNKKKPVIETKLLELLNNNDIPSNKSVAESDAMSNSSELTEIEDKIYYHLKLITLSSMDISSNIIFIITELMKFIDNYHIKGQDKKKVIVMTIKRYLEDENYPNIDYIVNTICPELIDILVNVDKRKITIKKRISCCF